jgi:hypothetical protein
VVELRLRPPAPAGALTVGLAEPGTNLDGARRARLVADGGGLENR